MNSEWGQIYKSLGATPIINAIGSVTMLGGSTPVPEVKEAMELAESAYIPLMELEEKAACTGEPTDEDQPMPDEDQPMQRTMCRLSFNISNSCFYGWRQR